MEEEYLLNCGPEQLPLSAGPMPGFLHPLNSLANDPMFDSAIGIVPIAGSFMIRELIMGKFGIYSPADISPAVITSIGAPAMDNSNANSSYITTPLSSPHRISIIPTILDHLANEQDHLANTNSTGTSTMKNSIPLTPHLSPLSRDPWSATNFSSSFHRSRSFNERTSLQAARISDGNTCFGTSTRVCSSNSLRVEGSQMGKQPNNNSAEHEAYHMENSAGVCRELSKMAGDDGLAVNSSEHSSLSGQKQSDENRSEHGNYTNSRKRKTRIKGKEKEFAPTKPSSSCT